MLIQKMQEAFFSRDSYINVTPMFKENTFEGTDLSLPSFNLFSTFINFPLLLFTRVLKVEIQLRQLKM